MYTDGCKIEKITRWQIHRIEVISYLCWCSFLFSTFTLRKANKSICICAFFINEQVSDPNTTPFFVLPHIRIFIFVWRILQAIFLALNHNSTVAPILDHYATFLKLYRQNIFLDICIYTYLHHHSTQTVQQYVFTSSKTYCIIYIIITNQTQIIDCNVF